MESSERLAAARAALPEVAERYARLVEQLDDLSVPIPGSDWTVRDAAVHLSRHGHRYAAMVLGDFSVSAVPIDKEFLDARARAIIDDNPETDPKKLADQIRETYTHLLDRTAAVPADQTIEYFGGLRPDFATTVSVVVGEPVLHGFDVATAVGVPWPIDPAHAAIAWSGFGPWLPAIFQPAAAAGLDATYRIEVAGADGFFVRITDGSYDEPAAADAVDCVISADPVAAVLVTSGRLSQWPAIALGRIRFGGPHPELGPRFAPLFRFP
jgi:uncharacterized protein (TIGR03083 family)